MNGSSLSDLANASPEQIKQILALMPREFTDRVREALPPGESAPQAAVTAPTEPTVLVEPGAPVPPAPFPVQPDTKPNAPMFAFDPPPAFERVPIDFALYDPERAQGRSILGILHGNIEFPKHASSGRALVITVMEPTPVVDNNGRVFEAHVGQDVIVEATFWLLALLRRSMDKEKVGEIWLRPLFRVPIGSGEFVPAWDIRSGRLHDRATFRQFVQSRASGK